MRFNRPVSRLMGSAIGVPLLSSFLSVVAWGQNPRINPAATKPVGQPKTEAAAPRVTHELTPADVETFLDGLMPLQVERDDIAGAVVVVVKNGKVLFAKGYGSADAEKKPVSPDNTLFRPGSISKLFTCTAVMQLVEQGKLDLDRDVNEYLDFKIPATYSQPVTLRRLMTHTAGFQETARDLFVANTRDLKPLRVYLASHLPARIFAPATTPAYSNYGMALAGYIVERVSGRPFEDYVSEFIFKPLGMTHSTFAQPLPEALKPLMSNGYLRASAGAKPFELVQVGPAGSLSTTGADIARFMIAHLQDGRLGDARILRPETARLMHARQFGLDRQMNAMAIGFYEESRNGHRIIGHGGDTMYFHSDLHLMPDAGLGFFVSYNSAGKGEISQRAALAEKFLDRYFPYEVPSPAPVATAVADARAVSGRYLTSRRNETSVLKLAGLLNELTVSAKPDGTIVISPLKEFNGQLRRWREIGPLHYRDVNGQARIAFLRGPAGQLELVADFPAILFQRVPRHETSQFILFVLGATPAILLLTLIFWPVAALVRRHYGKTLDLGPSERGLRIAVRLVCAFDLLVMLGWVVVFNRGMQDITFFSSRLNPRLYLLEWLGAIAAVATLVALYNCYRSWATRGRWLWSRLHDTVIALACLGYVWLALLFNLIRFNLMY